MSLADRINARIHALSLTQDEVALRAGISQGMVYKLTSGRAKRTSHIVELARALECELGWLATGEHFGQGVGEASADYQTNRDGARREEVERMLSRLPEQDQKEIALHIMQSLLDK
ncbi:hypothetical protein GCM10008090_03750 [Arenicella chitinivorans]|uniref:HTH cro/C1-type domain-containing protein n=1 Tax=Arenicella chitinivorans TaxID=1329800 RepID=A0A918RJ04_9GAMM|nr:helix-turn-helix transcriptional regulator [Arenicella chitinivorans]GGZ98510.1 hypothetical protein GCM10008090_03750 [Arenicella chitinivorans]